MVRLPLHSLHQLVASVISLATRFLCSASKSHPALILLLLAPEPDSLRWIPVRIRDENIQIVHSVQFRNFLFDTNPTFRRGSMSDRKFLRFQPRYQTAMNYRKVLICCCFYHSHFAPLSAVRIILQAHPVYVSEKEKYQLRH